jgi:hypothetical protein
VEPERALPPPYREDGGVAEAAPPPIDDRRWRHDQGVAEAAPPPIQRPLAQRALLITTDPPAPLRFAGRQVSQPFALVAGAGTLAVGGKGAPVAVRLCVVRQDARSMVLQVEADRPLTVRHGGDPVPLPAQVTVRLDELSPDLVVEDPASDARLRVRLGTR